MNNDIIPRRGAPTPPQPPSSSQPTQQVGPPRLPIQERAPMQPVTPPELPAIEDFKAPEASKRPRKKKILLAILGLFTAISVVLIAVGVYLLSPKDTSVQQPVSVEIVSGMVPGQIATELENRGVIRSRVAFLAYTRIVGVQNSLQAGNYQLSPADSVASIIAQLQKGPSTDEIEVTFKPGATLAENKQVLLTLGYSESEVNSAFSSHYDHPLFQDQPSGADLEGYLFGETHRFAKGTSVKDILRRYFDDYISVVEENDLVAHYRKQGLSLYEGITLASIIQRESGGDDKAQIAQVFLLRLNNGTPLGSDVTYQYIADKEGNPRDTNYDSPYNTRRYPGLPPGPIATPGVAALKAAANPAEGDYEFFLSGDDNVTYFARTLEEHEANIRNHCQQKCTII